MSEEITYENETDRRISRMMALVKYLRD